MILTKRMSLSSFKKELFYFKNQKKRLLTMKRSNASISKIQEICSKSSNELSRKFTRKDFYSINDMLKNLNDSIRHIHDPKSSASEILEHVNCVENKLKSNLQEKDSKLRWFYKHLLDIFLTKNFPTHGYPDEKTDSYGLALLSLKHFYKENYGEITYPDENRIIKIARGLSKHLPRELLNYTLNTIKNVSLKNIDESHLIESLHKYCDIHSETLLPLLEFMRIPIQKKDRLKLLKFKHDKEILVNTFKSEIVFFMTNSLSVEFDNDKEAKKKLDSQVDQQSIKLNDKYHNSYNVLFNCQHIPSVVLNEWETESTLKLTDEIENESQLISKKICVYNLPVGVNKEILSTSFSRCGGVEKIVIFNESFGNNTDNQKAKKTKQPGVRKNNRLKYLEKKAAYSDIYAFIYLSDQNSYLKATSQDMKIFGICINNRLCRIKEAEKFKDLYIQIDSTISLNEFYGMLRSYIGSNFLVNYSLINQKDLKTSVVQLKFDNHYKALLASHILSKQVKDLNSDNFQIDWLKTSSYNKKRQKIIGI